MNSMNRDNVKLFATVMVGSAVVASATMGVDVAIRSLNQHTTISAEGPRNTVSNNTIGSPKGTSGTFTKGASSNPSEPSEHPNKFIPSVNVNVTKVN